MLYVAHINLNSPTLTLGTNCAFEYRVNGNPPLATDTFLHPIFTHDGWRLVARPELAKLDPGLRCGFDVEVYLTDPNLSGEFFLSGYRGPQDHQDEAIYRIEKGSLQDITAAIQEIRDNQEGKREITNPAMRL